MQARLLFGSTYNMRLWASPKVRSHLIEVSNYQACDVHAGDTVSYNLYFKYGRTETWRDVCKEYHVVSRNHSTELRVDLVAIMRKFAVPDEKLSLRHKLSCVVRTMPSDDPAFANDECRGDSGTARIVGQMVFDVFVDWNALIFDEAQGVFSNLSAGGEFVDTSAVGKCMSAYWRALIGRRAKLVEAKLSGKAIRNIIAAHTTGAPSIISREQFCGLTEKPEHTSIWRTFRKVLEFSGHRQIFGVMFTKGMLSIDGTGGTFFYTAERLSRRYKFVVVDEDSYEPTMTMQLEGYADKRRSTLHDEDMSVMFFGKCAEQPAFAGTGVLYRSLPLNIANANWFTQYGAPQ